MIISNSREYIFVHITRAAGTSVTYALADSLKWNDLVIGCTLFGENIQNAYRDRFGMEKHSTGREIREMVGQEIWDRSFTFTFVRHPYARAVSLYALVAEKVKSARLGRYTRFLRPTKIREHHDLLTWSATQAYLGADGFSEFIRTDNFVRDRGAQPQTSWVLDKDGKRIVDFVGKVENIEKDFIEVARKIGVEYRGIGKENSSSSDRHPHEILSREDDYRYLYQLYKDDFRIFDYDAALRF